MKKFFMLIILFSMILTTKFLSLPDTHSSVLLAIGLIILGAYTLSEIGSSLKFPKVTGYILTGLLLGPFATGILSKNIVNEIEMFNTLAIGLIAIAAGLELHFSSLKKVILPILTTSFFKILFLSLSAVIAIFIANRYFHDFGLGPSLQLSSLALVFAALCLGTSPAISIAVISEMNAKSRMSQMILGSAIIKDILVIICLAISLSFAKSLTNSDVNTTGSFIHLMNELGLSLAAGMILGMVLIFYIRIVHQEMFLFIVAMILVTAKISEAIHLELLLVFIVAGIILRNFSKQEKVLHEALEKVSLPVFVVFFTNIGAGLDLAATWKFLPVAGLLFVARGLSFIAASRLAGHRHNEHPSIQNKIWLGYLPQAGVTLGLISIASKDLSVYSEVIENVGFGLVTLNLLLGPVFLRMILQVEEPDILNREINDSQNEDPLRGQEDVEEKTPEKQWDSDNDRDFNSMVNGMAKNLIDEKVKKHFLELSFRFYEIFKEQQILPQKRILDRFTANLRKIDGLNEEEIVLNIDKHLHEMGEKGHGIYNTIGPLQTELDQVSVVQLVPMPSSAIHIQKEDSLWIRGSKILHYPYYWFNKNSKREVPLRKIAKFNLEAFIGSNCLQLIHSWYHLLGRYIESFQHSLENKNFLSNDFLDQIENENEVWLKSMHSDFKREFKRTAIPWIRQLTQVNTVYLSDSLIRYSSVEPDIKENFETAKKNSLLWEEKFVFYRNRLKVNVQSTLLSDALEKLIREKFFNSIKEARINANELVDDIFSFFENIEKKMKEDSERKDETIYQNIREKTWAFAEQHLQADIKTKAVRGNFRLLNRDISISLQRSLPKEATHFQIASDQTPIHQIKNPSEILVKKINLYELFEQNIMINFLPFIEEKVEGISNYLEALLLEMEQTFSIINCALESENNEGHRSKNVEESILKTIDSERNKISELHRGFTNYALQVNSSVKKLLRECQTEVGRVTEHFSIATVAKNQFRQKLRNTVHLIQSAKQSLDKSIDDSCQKVKKLILHQSERDIDKIISSKILSRTLDTSTIRQFIEETHTISKNLNQLPRVYFRLFNLDPVQDKRFFIAYQNHWNYLKAFSKEESSRESQKILIIGDRGMGKSSLINIAQMDIKTGRLIRIDSDDNELPVKTLARTLNCNTNTMSLLQAMKKTSTTIIMDNADQLLNMRHLQEFEKLFELICQSSHEVHWILSITKCNLEALDLSYGIRGLFSKIIDLDKLDFNSGREIIFGRHRLSGLTIEYPKTFINNWALKLGLSTEDEMFFRVLFERSHGYVRHILHLWLLSLVSADSNSLKVSMERTMEWGMPMIHDFSVPQKYLLGQLYSHHHMNIKSLSNSLGTSPSIINNEVRYMEQCGLVQSWGADRTHFKIPNHLVTPVGQELKKEGIIHENTN